MEYYRCRALMDDNQGLELNIGKPILIISLTFSKIKYFLK